MGIAVLGKDKVVEMPDGYFRVKHVPAAEDLARFYAEKYYQGEHGPYRHKYSAEELSYFRNKTLERLHLVDGLQEPVLGRRMLDVGCGEGWALDVFAEAGWNVVGTDYTDTALLQHNPHLADRLLTGDLHAIIDRLAADRQTFEVIYLASVLEHVTDPERVLRDCLRVAAPDTVLVVAVPNDFTAFQAQLGDREIVQRAYWVALPDHINYFTAPALARLAVRCGWEVVRAIGDYPVEWHLLHPDSNYIAMPERGPAIHKARVVVENTLADTSIPATVQLFSWLLRLGMGRQITALLQPVSLGYRAFPEFAATADYHLRPARRSDMLRLNEATLDRSGFLDGVSRAGGGGAFYEDVVVPAMRAKGPSSVTVALERDEELVAVAHIAAVIGGATADVVAFGVNGDAVGIDAIREVIKEFARRDLGLHVDDLAVALA